MSGPTTIEKGPPKDMGHAGMGRADLERTIDRLRVELADARAANALLESAVEDADRYVARAMMRHDTMRDTLSATQEHCSRQLAELRLLREGGWLTPLVARIAKGREKYPRGCTVLAVLDEAGELAHAINKFENTERARDELLDIAATAMRLVLGEVDRGLVVDGLEQRRTDAK